MNRRTRKTVDLQNLPALTKRQQTEINAIKALSEDDIDFSDIPPLNEAFLKAAVRNPFYRPTKTSTTVRVDSDVLAWLKSQGKGYQTRINAILRDAMVRALTGGSSHPQQGQ